jgi:hypothetical protein
MGFMIDITGVKFGRLTALRRVGTTKQRSPIWECRCDCGKIATVSTNHLRNHRIVSCGCYSSEITSERNYKHGETKTKLHNIWIHMRRRCNDKTHDKYQYYGGKGVSVCKEWQDDFLAFKSWAIENGYQDGLSIDRIDSNANYEPNNCRWADIETQMNNKSDNRLVTIGGDTKTVAQWAKCLGLTYSCFIGRVRKYEREGMTNESYLTRPVCPKIAQALTHNAFGQGR